jgi:hypothetical protein
MAVTTADEALAAPGRFAEQPLAVVALVRRNPASVFPRADTDAIVVVVPATLNLTSCISPAARTAVKCDADHDHRRHLRQLARGRPRPQGQSMITGVPNGNTWASSAIAALLMRMQP